MSVSDTETVLVTGADGYVGSLVARRLIAGTDARLLLAVHAARAGPAATLAAESPGRVRVVAADLSSGEPFAAVDPGTVTCILHTAAVTRFNVEHDIARTVNVEGTDKVVAFARRCPRLRRLLALSSIYSAGRRTGPIREVPFGDAGFVNHYEWSKWEGERRLLQAADLPVAIARLGTVIADDDTGRVVQHNAFHNTFRLVYHGLLSVVPGDAGTPIYLLTGAWAAEALVRLLLADPASGIYHVCPQRSDAPTLGELLDDVLAVFEESPAYRARRLLRPLLCDRRAFEGLVTASRTLGASPLQQAVASVAPFAEQLFLHKDVDNRRLRGAVPSLATPDRARLVRTTAASLVATGWGRATRRAS